MSEEDAALPDIPFARMMGIEIESATPDEVIGRLQWSADHLTSTGVLHGGALMALGDALGAICAFLNLPSGAKTATIESHTNFIRAVREGAVDGVSHAIHVGRVFIVTQTDLFDLEGRLAARVTQTQAVISPEWRSDIDEAPPPR